VPNTWLPSAAFQMIPAIVTTRQSPKAVEMHYRTTHAGSGRAGDH
jgi:hypothetical protein